MITDNAWDENIQDEISDEYEEAQELPQRLEESGKEGRLGISEWMASRGTVFPIVSSGLQTITETT